MTEIPEYDFSDSLYVDDRFEMYVLYFTGSDPTHPGVQRPLGRLAWNWGGLVVFDWNWNLMDAFHTIRSTNAPPTGRTGEVFPPSMQTMSSMVPMQGNVTSIPVAGLQCTGGPAFTNNRIDSARYFVRQHYLDFLGRNPAGDSTHDPDLAGWDFWNSGISQCVFDLNCIHSKRISTGLAFFYSAEFSHTDPAFANPPGSPGFNAAVYNRAFVRYCYIKYLQVDPLFDDDGGWDFWTDVLDHDGNYGHTIDAFQVCGDYRNRFAAAS